MTTYNPRDQTHIRKAMWHIRRGEPHLARRTPTPPRPNGDPMQGDTNITIVGNLVADPELAVADVYRSAFGNAGSTHLGRQTPEW